MKSGNLTCAIFLSLTGLLFLLGCASTKPEEALIPEGASIDLESITIQASPLANNSKPVTLDILFVYEEPALRRLQGYTAEGWFVVKQTDLIDWGDSAEWTTLNISPGEQVTLSDFSSLKNKPLALTFFADYRTPGLHRYFVVGGSRFLVQLEERGYVVGGE